MSLLLGTAVNAAGALMLTHGSLQRALGTRRRAALADAAQAGKAMATEARSSAAGATLLDARMSGGRPTPLPLGSRLRLRRPVRVVMKTAALAGAAGRRSMAGGG